MASEPKGSDGFHKFHCQEQRFHVTEIVRQYTHMLIAQVAVTCESKLIHPYNRSLRTGTEGVFNHPEASQQEAVLSWGGR